jgi:nitroreductase
MIYLTGDFMSDLIDEIMNRRSIRKFKSDMVPKEDIDKIIKAGLYAPSGRGLQSPIIIAVTNKEFRDKLATVNRKIGGFPEDLDPFYNGPVVLIVLADKSTHTHVYDGSVVMENLLLAASGLGYGSIWIHRAKEEFEMDEYKKVLKDLGIDGDYEGIGHCVIGYIDEDIPEAAPRKDNRVYYID